MDESIDCHGGRVAEPEGGAFENFVPSLGERNANAALVKVKLLGEVQVCTPSL